MASSLSTLDSAFVSRLDEGLASRRAIWRPLPHQEHPPFTQPDWDYWLVIGGRGIGKTDAGAYALDKYMKAHPGHRGRIIAPTLGDAREACVIGPSGVHAHNPEVHWNANEGALTWPNGSRAKIFGAYTPEDVERLRAGGNSHFDWYEEFAAWAKLDEAWDQARFGLRLGSSPRTIITTTPKPKDRLRWLLGYHIALMGANPRVVVSRATTDENPHLAANVRSDLYARYQGTRLGRQELAGELLDDIPGALWQQVTLDAGRVHELPDLVRVVIGVDPAVTSTEGSDETGVIIVGKGIDGHAYVFADRSVKLGLDRAAPGIITAYHTFQADRIVAERNNGGDMVEATFRAIDPDLPVRTVVASRGKRVRAEPVAALYEQGRVHHYGGDLGLLEDQMTTFLPEVGGSPDRVDGLVWALTDLMLDHQLTLAMPTLARAERLVG